ncbi:MAG: hypothetical protein ACOCRK_00790 [bacterium]
MEIVDIEFDFINTGKDLSKNDILKIQHRIERKLEKNSVIYDKLIVSHYTLFTVMFKIPAKIIGLSASQAGLLVDNILKDSMINKYICGGRISSLEHNDAFIIVLEKDSKRYHIFKRENIPEKELRYVI